MPWLPRRTAKEPWEMVGRIFTWISPFSKDELVGASGHTWHIWCFLLVHHFIMMFSSYIYRSLLKRSMVPGRTSGVVAANQVSENGKDMQKGFDALYSFLLLRFEEDCLKVVLGLWVVFTSLKGLQIATLQKDQGKQSRNSNCKWVGDLIWVIRLFDFFKYWTFFIEFIALALLGLPFHLAKWCLSFQDELMLRAE